VRPPVESWPKAERLPRESRTLQKTKFPRSVYEVWLSEQHPGHVVRTQRTPPRDVYEAWVEEKVRRKISTAHENVG